MFSTDFRKVKFQENLSSGSCVRDGDDRRTDRQTYDEANSRFSQFAILRTRLKINRSCFMILLIGTLLNNALPVQRQ